MLVRQVPREQQAFVPVPLGGLVVAGLRGEHRLHHPDGDEVVVARERPEQELCLIQVRLCLAELLGVDEGHRAIDVRPCEMKGVLGRLEERDRAPEAVQRAQRLRALEREPAERPVQADAGVRVDIGARLRERLAHDRLCPRQVAGVGEGEAAGTR